MERVLILADSVHTDDLLQSLADRYPEIKIAQSELGTSNSLPTISISSDFDSLIHNYDLIVSIHCKKIFPSELVNSVRCINVHPGFNPFNRGWFPHVFSIINNQKSGVTIHEMNVEIDHGPIISQVECPIYSWDTSCTLYERIITAERNLVLDWFDRLVECDYSTFYPEKGGSNNKKSDFSSLCEIDLEEVGSFGDHINRLRALSHKGFRNAYFFDEEGNKIFLSLGLEKE